MPGESKTVLVLGSGLMAPCVVEYLTLEANFNVILGSRTLENAEKVANDFGHGKCTCVRINVEDENDHDILEENVKKSQAVISMLPYLFHHIAAKVGKKKIKKI